MKTFPLFGKTLTFTEKELKYTEILRKYTRLSEQYRKKYETAYKKFGDWETLWEQGEALGNEYIAEAAEEVVKAYVANGKYDYVADEALCCCKEYFEWKGLWLDIEDVLTKFYEQYADVQKFRNLRKQNRSRVGTVGFGVKGTIGAAIANEAANAATGLMHDFINSLATSSDYARIKRHMQKWYQNDGLRNKILDTFQNVIFALRQSEESLYDIDHEDYLPRDSKRADALLDNLQYIEPDKQQDILIEILQLNPYCREAYEQLLEQYGDPNAEVYALLQVFPVYDEQKLVHNTIKKARKAVNSQVDFDSMQAVQRKALYEFVCELERLYHPSVIANDYASQNYISKIKNMLVTVQHQKYASFDEAEAVRKDFDNFGKQIGNIYAFSDERLSSFISQLKAYNQKFPNSVNKFCERADEEEKRRRSVHSITFDTLEQAKQAEKVRVAANKVLSAARGQSINKINAALIELDALVKDYPPDLLQDIILEARENLQKATDLIKRLIPLLHEMLQQEKDMEVSRRLEQQYRDVNYDDMSRENYDKLVALRQELAANYNEREARSVISRLNDFISLYDNIVAEQKKLIAELEQKAQQIPSGGIFYIIFRTMIRAAVCFGILYMLFRFLFNIWGGIIAFITVCYFFGMTYEKWAIYKEGKQAMEELKKVDRFWER